MGAKVQENNDDNNDCDWGWEIQWNGVCQKSRQVTYYIQRKNARVKWKSTRRFEAYCKVCFWIGQWFLT